MAGAPADHSHYWKPVGSKGKTWHKGHALGRCIRRVKGGEKCSAWTVLGFQERVPYGPCRHNVGYTPEEAAIVVTELQQCERCGRILEGDEKCELCEL